MRYGIKLAALVACVVITQPAEAAWLGSTVAGVGDFLSNWGRDTPATVSGAAPPPTVKATGTTGDNCNKRHKQLADQNIQDRAALDDQMIKPSTKGIGEMACFDKYKNFSLAGMFGFPSFDSIFSQLAQQACTYADQQVNQATQPINQSVWLPGGAKVNTGAVFGSQAAGKGPVSAGAQSTGQFQLPQIFK